MNDARVSCLRPAATGLLVLLLAGCVGPFADTRVQDIESLRERLSVIEPMKLEALAKPASADPAAPAPLAEVSLTIEQCRAIALEGNLDLQVELITPAIARQDITQAEAAFEALFFASGGFIKRDTATASSLTGSQSETITANAGVTVPLRTGGSITLDSPFSRNETNLSDDFLTLNPAQNTMLRGGISLPLLRNAGRRTNEHAIRVAQWNYQISQARGRLAVIRVLAEVERVYWTLYAARQELDVRKEELRLAEELLESARRRVREGLVAEVEIIRAESGVADRKETIIIAENTVRERQRELKRILRKPGLEMNTPTILIPQTLPDPMLYQLDTGRVMAAAIDNRMEMLELELQLLQDASTIDFQKNQILPLIVADYTYNVNGLGETLRDSLHQIRENSFADHNVSLRGEIPLGNELAESNLRRAMITRMQRLATKDQRQAQIEQEVLNALDDLEANWHRILAARQRTILADRVLQAERRQFEEGLRIATDVLDAQTRLGDAQSAEVRALTDYQISQVNLAFASGTLLGATQVRWEESGKGRNDK